nr:hypothetical protein [uncultured Campylobacter sp.]
MNYLLFLATLFPISLMPGINMTYAMSIGMSLGYARASPRDTRRFARLRSVKAMLNARSVSLAAIIIRLAIFNLLVPCRLNLRLQ